MTYHVHAVEQDLAGKWYARVCLSDTEATFLKFQDYPIMADIQDAAVAYVAAQVEATRPAAEAIGQEWTDITGQLWRVVQARDGDGQFTSDDPATPERESLIWAEVSDGTAE